MTRYLPAVVALALVACASQPSSTQTTQKPMEEKEYRVGSRIPVRDSVSSSPSTTLDPSALGSGAPARPN